MKSLHPNYENHSSLGILSGALFLPSMELPQLILYMCHIHLPYTYNCLSSSRSGLARSKYFGTAKVKFVLSSLPGCSV